MKIYYSASFFYILFCTYTLHAQPSGNRDSISQKYIRGLSKELSLTNGQEDSIENIEVTFSRQRDSIAILNLNLEERKRALTVIMNAHENSMKPVLNENQLNLWKELVERRKKIIRDLNKKSNMRITEITTSQ